MELVEMTKEAKAARAQYMREYRRKYPEKEAASKARYWEKRAAQLRTNADNQSNSTNEE